MTKQHAVHLLTNALTGDNDNGAFRQVATVYAGLVVGAVGLVIRDSENFFDEALGYEDDHDRGEAMDKIGLFIPRGK